MLQAEKTIVNLAGTPLPDILDISFTGATVKLIPTRILGSTAVTNRLSKRVDYGKVSITCQFNPFSHGNFFGLVGHSLQAEFNLYDGNGQRQQVWLYPDALIISTKLTGLQRKENCGIVITLSLCSAQIRIDNPGPPGRAFSDAFNDAFG